MNKNQKVAIYTRVANNESQESLKNQKDSCIALAKDKFGEKVNLEFF